MSIFQLTEFMLCKSLKTQSPTVGNTLGDGLSQHNKQVFKNDSICRVCTNPATVLLTERWNDTIIMSALRTVTSLSITEADLYPKYICANCLEELKVAYQFKKKCEASDMLFRTSLSSESLLCTSSGVLVMHDFSLILQQMKQKRQQSQLTPEIKEESCVELYTLYNDYSPLNKLDADSTGGDSSDNEVISSLCKRTDTFSCTKKSSCKVMKRKTRKKNHDMKDSRNIQSRIVNLLEFKSNVESKPRKYIKKAIIKKLQRCRRCDLKFDTKKEYEEHKEQNNCIYHSCPQCGKLVLNLAKHEQIMHLRSDKYTCDQCGKIFYSSSALYNHMHIHKTTQEYSCDLCPYKGKRKSYLVCHMRMHTGERRYLCTQCPAKFKDISNLKKHQQVHENKDLECSKCEKMFRNAKSLKQHFDFAHLNIRYRCAICGRELCSRKKLLNHELRVHKREKHKLFDNEQKVVILSNEK